MVSKAPTVAAYLKELPADRKATMQALRKLIKKIAPTSKESMEYGMPCYWVDGVAIVGMNAQKHYYSLYICDTDVVARNRKLLGKLSCGKCCIRFRKLADLPMELAERIIREAIDQRMAKGNA